MSSPAIQEECGFWYLLLVLLGPLRLIYIPTNSSCTTTRPRRQQHRAHEWLFRFGMLSDLLGAVVLIFLVLAFTAVQSVTSSSRCCS